MIRRAEALSALAHDAVGPGGGALIGGATYLIVALEAALRVRGVAALHAFSIRDVSERVGRDGATRKQVVFRHLGFVCDGEFVGGTPESVD